MDAEGFAYRGSTDYLSRGKPPQRSAAVDDLIRRVQPRTTTCSM